MRTALVVPLFMLSLVPSLAALDAPSRDSPSNSAANAAIGASADRRGDPGIGPAPGSAPSADTDEARWAEWEAQSRISDGDYEGAVQAQRQADANRQEADRREMLARRPQR